MEQANIRTTREAYRALQRAKRFTARHITTPGARIRYRCEVYAAIRQGLGIDANALNSLIDAAITVTPYGDMLDQAKRNLH